MLKLIKRFLGFQEVTQITISQSVVADLCEMAQSAHPKEMLAFIASTKGVRKGVVHIDELQLQAYDASENSAHAFFGNIPMTTSIIGTVHSHPGGSKRPSEADQHLFNKFGYVHAIIGEPYRLQDIRFYNKNGTPIIVRVSNA